MNHKYGVWIELVLVAVSATLAAKYYPYFPGDVAVARWVQALLPAGRQWAVVASRAGEFPWILLILALVFSLSWVLAGWRAALASILSLAGMLALGAGSGRWWPGPGRFRNWCRCGGPLPALAFLPNPY